MNFWRRLRWISLALFIAMLLLFAFQGGADAPSTSGSRTVPTFHN